MEELRLANVTVSELAYLGDSVMELLVREQLVRRGLGSSKKLNTEALRYVTAPAQAEAAERVLPHLNEAEATAYRRGRNSKHLSHPRSATASEYQSATGLEVLFGYIHLTGDRDRLLELFSIAYPGLAASS